MGRPRLDGDEGGEQRQAGRAGGAEPLSTSANTTPPKTERRQQRHPASRAVAAVRTSGFPAHGLSVIRTTAAASGRLMKNTQRHDACWTSHPPITGPIAAVIAVKPDQVPMARPRVSSGNDALISARLPGTSSAAPTPCTARAAISCPIDRRQAAPGRGQREHRDADSEDLAPAEQVAQRPAGQQQRGQRQGVGLDHPLHVDERGVEGRLQRRQRDVHDRAVDERHAGAEDGRREDPARRAFRRADRRRRSRSPPRQQGGFKAIVRSRYRERPINLLRRRAGRRRGHEVDFSAAEHDALVMETSRRPVPNRSVLAINSGSSSVKFGLFDARIAAPIARCAAAPLDPAAARSDRSISCSSASAIG